MAKLDRRVPGRSKSKAGAKSPGKSSAVVAARPGGKSGRAAGLTASAMPASKGAAAKPKKGTATAEKRVMQSKVPPVKTAGAQKAPVHAGSGRVEAKVAAIKTRSKADMMVSRSTGLNREAEGDGALLEGRRAETVTMSKKTRTKSAPVVLPEGYRPSDAEPFMNEYHRAYFRRKLQQWKDDIIAQNRETLQVLHEDTLQHADLADRATSETDRALELRARDRQRKLISKIDAAISRIEDGSYGYCEETGEPISLKRLDARPIATLSLEAQERHERRERVYRDD